MIEVRPFEPAHLNSFRPDEIDRIALQKVDIDAFAAEQQGAAITAMEDGITIGVAGITLIDGEHYGWILGSERLRRGAVFLTRSVKRALPAVMEALAIDNVKAWVPLRAGDLKAITWTKRLGFEFVRTVAGNPGYAEYVKWRRQQA